MLAVAGDVNLIIYCGDVDITGHIYHLPFWDLILYISLIPFVSGRGRLPKASPAFPDVSDHYYQEHDCGYGEYNL